MKKINELLSEELTADEKQELRSCLYAREEKIDNDLRCGGIFCISTQQKNDLKYEKSVLESLIRKLITNEN